MHLRLLFAFAPATPMMAAQNLILPILCTTRGYHLDTSLVASRRRLGSLDHPHGSYYWMNFPGYNGNP